MKPELEIVSSRVQKYSFQYFRIKRASFDPYWHYHPEIELTYIVKGEGTRFIGNHIAQYQAGDLVLIGKNLPHHWVSIQEDSHAIQEAIVIQFLTEDLIRHAEFDPILSLLSKARVGLHFQNPSSSLYDTIEAMEQQEESEQLLSLLSVLQVLTKEEHHALSSMQYHLSDKNMKQQAKADKITRYILENLQNPISLQEISDIAHMTPPSFSRWFTKTLGNSFTTYVNMARIEQASQYLITTDLPVNEIAIKVGFVNTIYFNRVFKRIKKIQPTQFRKANKKILR